MAAPRRGDVKGAILDAAERLMAAGELETISLAAIAKEAGVSKGTLYYHYKTKNEILYDLTARYLKEQREALLTWTGDASKDTSAHRLLRYVAQRNVINEHMRMRLLCGAVSGDDGLKAKLNERYEEFAALLAQSLTERAPSLKADYLAWLVLLVCDGLIVQKTLGGSLDAEAFIERSAELIKNVEHHPDVR